LVEVGTPIRIIHRINVRSIVIQLYHCVIQYNGGLKTERYGGKQVVLLSPLILLYQEFNFEGNQKYGRWESVLGSLVFHRSKDDETGHEPLPG
jgi:hypothetical protein